MGGQASLSVYVMKCIVCLSACLTAIRGLPWGLTRGEGGLVPKLSHYLEIEGDVETGVFCSHCSTNIKIYSI